MEPKKILALDPASVTGFAHSAGEHGAWRLAPGDARYADFRRRNLETIDFNGGADIIAYELASYGAAPSGRGRKVQWTVIQMHNALRGVILQVAGEIGAEARGYHISTIKAQTTGSGKAPKAQVMACVERLYGIKCVDSNEADAIAILEMAKRGFVQPPSAKKRAKAVKKDPRQARLFK